MRPRALGVACGIALSVACTDASRSTGVDPDIAPSLATTASAEWPNQPTGLSALTSRPFSTKARNARDGRGAEGWSVAEAWTQLSITDDAAAPKSPSRVGLFPLQARWTGGTDVSRGAATYYLNGKTVRTLYTSVWVKVSSTWQGPRDGTNGFFHLTLDNADRASIGVKGAGTGALVPTLFLADAAPDARVALAPNVASNAALERGRWQRWEVLLTLNNPGAADGVVRWWVDGALVSDHRDVKFIGDREADRWFAFQARLTWGTAADRVPASMHLRVDHAYLGYGEGRDGGSSEPPPPPPPPTTVAHSVTVTPPSAAMAPSDSVQFAAAVRDSAGYELPGQSITWRSTNAAVATASAIGLVKGVAPGTASIIAQSGTLADTAAITVSLAPPPAPSVTRLDLLPAAVSIATGATQQFTATEQLSDGASRAATGVTWSATGGTVNATGLYTAGSSGGTFRVIARGTTGHADTASITITAPPPPPPPPSGSCAAPNLLSHGFDNQSFSPLSGTEGAYITADATARGGYAVRKDWTGGSHDGSTIWANFASTRTVYARWRFKYDSRFDTDGIFKMIRFHAPNLGTMNGTLLIQWGRFVWAWDTFSSAFYQNVGSEITPASLKGDWHWFEVMNDISANGTPRVRLWIDGQLKMDAAGSSTAATNNLSFGTIQWTGTYNSPAATATSWLDDVAVSTNCIGVPDGGTTPPPAPGVSAVIVSPATASVAAGATQQFSATERLSDGSTRPATGVIWAATGGLISGSGVFTAGAVAGSYRVIGVGAGGLADTAAVTVTTSTTPPPTSGAPTNECASPRSGWIWCDDFEQNRLSSYFEVDNGGGGFARTTGVGRNGSVGMRARWAAGQVEAGNLKLAFGRTPNAYFRAADAGTANYRNVYWRAYVRTQAGWTGGAGWKFTRAIVFANANWAEAAIGSVSGFWENTFLTATGQSGTDAAGNLVTTRYNDFDNLRTVASADGSTRLFDGANANAWHCVEGHMQLNDAGQSNGVLEFWVNGTLQARQANVNWLGAFNAYGINALFFENYWNGGPPQAQERYWDNLVVSTQPIGC